MKFKESFW